MVPFHVPFITWAFDYLVLEIAPSQYKRGLELKNGSSRLLACLAILLFLAGCGASVEEREEPTATQAFSDSPLESPLQPTPTAIASCLTLIEPSGNTVCGYIINRFDGKPVAGRPVFLAKALFSEDGSTVFSALDQNTAPQGVTDENGMFSVTDLPADMYFLMLSEFPQPIMLKEPDKPENDLYIDWREEGGVVDLGIIPAEVFTQAP